MKNFRILNKFGILPTKNCRAAGYDFFVPNLVDRSEEDTQMILEAFSKSFKKSVDELETIGDRIMLEVSAVHGEEFTNGQALNFLHLFLSLTSYTLACCDTLDDKVETFVSDYLTFDSNKTPGLVLESNDHIFINSGLKVKVDDGYAGIYFNKSGRGTKGFDVRACVVDEDYAGFVHLSLAYTSDDFTNGTFYCGDKITQMLIIKVESPDVVEVSEEEFADAHATSERGENGFGSSDVKH